MVAVGCKTTSNEPKIQTNQRIYFENQCSLEFEEGWRLLKGKINSKEGLKKAESIPYYDDGVIGVFEFHKDGSGSLVVSMGITKIETFSNAFRGYPKRVLDILPKNQASCSQLNSKLISKISDFNKKTLFKKLAPENKLLSNFSYNTLKVVKYNNYYMLQESYFSTHIESGMEIVSIAYSIPTDGYITGLIFSLPIEEARSDEHYSGANYLIRLLNSLELHN